MNAEPNAWQKAGAPPEEPKAQLGYLRNMVELFHRIENPRLKALRRKLDAALMQLVQSSEGKKAAEVAEELATRLEALRRETFEVLLVVVNQVRGTLKAKLAGGLTPAGRASSEKLHQGLTRFAKALRELVTATERNDPEAASAAGKLMDEAARTLDAEAK
jgi:hypothetical protein